MHIIGIIQHHTRDINAVFNLGIMWNKVSLFSHLTGFVLMRLSARCVRFFTSCRTEICIAEACFFSNRARWIRHSSCYISAACTRVRQKNEKEETHTRPGARTSVTFSRGLTLLSPLLSPSLWTRSRAVCFCSSRKKGKCGCMKMQKAFVAAQKPCVSLLSNNLTMSAAPLFHFQTPYNIKRVGARLTCRCQ